MSDLLALTANLPEVELAPGEVLTTAGGPSGPIWILMSGSLRVVRDGVEVNTISQPGAAVGEMSVLLGSDHTATIEAIEPARLRVAEDGHAFLASDPEVTRIIAVGMAQRLVTVTGYLADLTQQYGDHPGLAMVSDVLRQLSHDHHHVASAAPGSARDPDPEY
jgi:CRP/FNR family cyclic AMP-dependent transcriptional regulator